MNVILAALTLSVWVGAVMVLVCEDRTDRFLWISVVLALAGAFSSILPLVISLKAAFVTNGILLTLFIVAMETLSEMYRRTVAVAKFRTE